MANYYSQVKSRIHEISDNMSDSQFFASRPYRDYVDRIVQGISADVGRRVRLIMVQDPTMTACTDGNDIIVNTEGSLVTCYERRFMKHRAIMGLTEHELAHVLFTDFQVMRRSTEAISKGNWYPSCPYDDGHHPEQAANVQDITDLIQNDPKIGDIVVGIWHQIANSVEDAHIELRMCDRYPGFSRDIASVNVSICEKEKYIDEEEAAAATEQDPLNAAGMRLQLILNALLCYAKFGSVKVHDGYSSELLSSIYDCVEFVDSAVANSDPVNRAEKVNMVFVNLWPYLKDVLDKAEEQKQKEGEGESNAAQSGGAGSSQSSDDKATEILREILKQIASKSSNAPQNRNTRPIDGRIGDADAARSQATGGNSAGHPLPKPQSKDSGSQSGEQKDPAAQQNPQQSSSGKNGGSRPDSGEKKGQTEQQGSSPESAEESKQLETIARQIATQIAEEQVAAQHRSDLQSEVGSFSGCEHVRVDRPVQVTPDMVQEYNRIVHKNGNEDLMRISRKLQRQMMAILKNKIEGGKQTRLPMGNRISIKDLIRGDDLFFEKRRLPQDKSDLSVCVLIDESGSMSGERREAAMKTAIVLEDFLRNMNIPCCIFGHTDRAGCVLTCYADFDKVDQRDRYRITALTANGGTPTAHALRACYGRMAKREEGNKLIIVITDGCPGDNADGTIQTLIRESHRKNIDIFGVGLAGCAKHLEAIYGGRTVAISDLNELPCKIASIVKRYVRFV